MPLIMIVDKNYDGTYLIHGDTIKIPFYEEILDNMRDRCSPDRECFAIIVDVNELLDSARDISKTVCGFRILADSMEIYDSYDAIRLFGTALKEACHSGRCTVDDDFH